MALQTKLDELYQERAQGAFVRSRAKWIEEGKITHSFNLERNRQQRNYLKSFNKWE